MMLMNCKICNAEFKIGGGLHRHLKKHGITKEEYRTNFPKEFDEYTSASKEKRRQNSPMSLDFYLNKGFTIEDSRVKLGLHLAKKNQKVKENKFKNPSTYDYWLALGFTKLETADILSKNNSRGLDYFISKYGTATGRNKFELMVSKRASENKKDKAVKKLMVKNAINYDEALEIFKEKHRNGPKNIGYWLERGYSIDEAKIKIKEKAKVDSPRRREYWKLRYAMTDKEAVEAVSRFQARDQFSVSKESIKIFQQLSKKIYNSYPDMTDSDVLFGSRKSEFKLYDDDLDQIYYYDFCCPKLNFIVEYHGSKFHPNAELLGENIKNWKQLYSGADADTILQKDMRKRDIAKQHKFCYFEIWDTDNIEEKMNEILIKCRRQK